MIKFLKNLFNNTADEVHIAEIEKARNEYNAMIRNRNKNYFDSAMERLQDYTDQELKLFLNDGTIVSKFYQSSLSSGHINNEWQSNKVYNKLIRSGIPRKLLDKHAGYLESESYYTINMAENKVNEAIRLIKESGITIDEITYPFHSIAKWEIITHVKKDE